MTDLTGLILFEIKECKRALINPGAEARQTRAITRSLILSEQLNRSSQLRTNYTIGLWTSLEVSLIYGSNSRILLILNLCFAMLVNSNSTIQLSMSTIGIWSREAERDIERII